MPNKCKPGEILVGNKCMEPSDVPRVEDFSWRISKGALLRAKGLIHLQDIGDVPAIPARELKPGMRLSWNYAYKKYEVASIRDASKDFIEIVERNIETGSEHVRRLKKDRLVAASNPA
jgi:hypothetical protein